MSKLLDVWEKDALSINQTYSVEGPDGKLRSYDDAQAWRIRRLIELVRKKDEALNIAIASLDRVPEEIYSALALTDQLGGSGE